MVLKLPNELIAEMAKFIPYKPLDPGDHWSNKEYAIPPSGPILSSFVLSYFITNNWRKIKIKRKEMLIHIVDKLEEIRKEIDYPDYLELKMMLYNNGPYFKINEIHNFERKIGWYWDAPREKGNFLCTLCLKWGRYEKGEFIRCPNSIHLFHILCYYKFFDFCFKEHWCSCNICYPFWYDYRYKKYYE